MYHTGLAPPNFTTADSARQRRLCSWKPESGKEAQAVGVQSRLGFENAKCRLLELSLDSLELRSTPGRYVSDVAEAYAGQVRTPVAAPLYYAQKIDLMREPPRKPRGAPKCPC